MDKPEDRLTTLQETIAKQRRAYKTAERMLHAKIEQLEKTVRDVKWWRRNLHAETLLAVPDAEDLDKILDAVVV